MSRIMCEGVSSENKVRVFTYGGYPTMMEYCGTLYQFDYGDKVIMAENNDAAHEMHEIDLDEGIMDLFSKEGRGIRKQEKQVKQEKQAEIRKEAEKRHHVSEIEKKHKELKDLYGKARKSGASVEELRKIAGVSPKPAPAAPDAAPAGLPPAPDTSAPAGTATPTATPADATTPPATAPEPSAAPLNATDIYIDQKGKGPNFSKENINKQLQGTGLNFDVLKNILITKKNIASKNSLIEIPFIDVEGKPVGTVGVKIVGYLKTK